MAENAALAPLRDAPCDARGHILSLPCWFGNETLIYSHLRCEVSLHPHQGITFKVDRHASIHAEAFAGRNRVDVVPTVDAKRININGLTEDVDHLAARHTGTKLVHHALCEHVSLIHGDLVYLGYAELRHGNGRQSATARNNQGNTGE